MLEKLIGRIATALQLSESDSTAFIGTLKDGDELLGDQEVADKVAELVNRQLKAAKEASLKRGKREGFAPVKSWLKEKGVIVEDDMQIVEILSQADEHFSKKQDSDIDKDRVKTLTKEELAGLPDVKQLMAGAYEKGSLETKATLDKVSQEYEAFKRSAKREQVSEITRRFVAESLENGDVLLEPTGVQGVSKEKRIETVLRSINLDRVDIVEKNGKKIPVFVDENGDVEEDDMGRPKDVAKFVVDEGRSIYGPRGVDPNKGGGDPKQGNGKDDYKRVHTFADEKAYNELMSTLPPGPERAQAARDYQHQQQQKAAG